MARHILLADLDDNSIEAKTLLEEAEIKFDLLLIEKDSIWKEINWPIPTIFRVSNTQDQGVIKGISQIRMYIKDIKNGEN